MSVRASGAVPGGQQHCVGNLLAGREAVINVPVVIGFLVEPAIL